MSCAHTDPAADRHPRRVLVVITRRIGDVPLATPPVRSSKRAWLDARIDAWVFAGTRGVLSGNPDLNQVMTIAERPGFAAHVALLARLFRRCDFALSLVPGDRPMLYAWLSRQHSIGLLVDQPDQRWKRKLLAQWVPFNAVNAHTLRSHLSLVTAPGLTLFPDVVTAWLPDVAAAVVALLGKSCPPLTVLHPYPQFRYKMWHAEGWPAVARWFMANSFRVALTGSPDADERTYVEPIVLFGPSDPVKWGPWPQGHAVANDPWQCFGNQRVDNVQLIQGRAVCAPCVHEGCERQIGSASDCLLAITEETVIQSIKTIGYET